MIYNPINMEESYISATATCIHKKNNKISYFKFFFEIPKKESDELDSTVQQEANKHICIELAREYIDNYFGREKDSIDIDISTLCNLNKKAAWLGEPYSITHGIKLWVISQPKEE